VIDYVLERPHMRRFYYFTSHDTLAFSRCSDYPFDTSGLPTLRPRSPRASHWSVGINPKGVERYEHFDEAMRVLEAALAADHSTTWRGNAEVPMRRDLDESLANLGRPERLELRGSSLFVVGTNVRVSRIGNEAFCSVHFGEDEWQTFTTREAAAEAIVAWLDADG
jgi:hypothetical protein